MFGRIRRILGNIKITETATTIKVDGVDSDVIGKDIHRIWKTNRINTHMFTRVGRDGFEFPLFFAPDILYILETMIEQRNARTSRRTLAKIRDKLLTETWLAGTQRDVSPILDSKMIDLFIYKPMVYQQTFYDNYDRLTQQYHLNGFLLAAAAGSGKTLTGLCLAEQLHADRIIVLCPKVATERVWEKSINDLYKKQSPTYWIHQHKQPWKNQRVVVYHYEALKDALLDIDRLKAENIVLILDESHNLNDIDSLRTRQYLDLIKQLDIKHIVPASGTAVKSMGAELIPLLRAIDPLFTEDAERRFRSIYGKDGNRGLDILNHRLGLISHKVEKHELGLDKPNMESLKVTVPDGHKYTLTAIRKDMTAFIEERFKYYKARKAQDQAFYDMCLQLHEATIKTPSELQAFHAYKANVVAVQKAGGDPRVVGPEIKATNVYEKNAIHLSIPKQHRNQFKDVKSAVKYVNLKIQGEALGRVLGRKRIECHVAMVPHVNFKEICESTTKKTVVFTSFVEALEESQNYLTNAAKMNPVMVYGKTNSELNKTVRLFEKDEDLNPLLATYQSLSTAVPLIMADTMIMLDSPFRDYIREQAISRIHRLGADSQTTVWEVSLDTGNEANISTRSADILAWSTSQVEAILGIKSPFTVNVDDTNTRLTVSAEDFDDLAWDYSLSAELHVTTGLEAIMTEW